MADKKKSVSQSVSLVAPSGARVTVAKDREEHYKSLGYKARRVTKSASRSTDEQSDK